MCRDYAPCALHHELHQEGADGQYHQRAWVDPEWDEEAGADYRYRHRAAPADSIGEKSEGQAAEQRAYIIDKRDSRDGASVEAAMLFEKCRVHVLGAVRDEVHR